MAIAVGDTCTLHSTDCSSQFADHDLAKIALYSKPGDLVVDRSPGLSRLVAIGPAQPTSRGWQLPTLGPDYPGEPYRHREIAEEAEYSRWYFGYDPVLSVR